MPEERSWAEGGHDVPAWAIVLAVAFLVFVVGLVALSIGFVLGVLVV